MQLRCNECVDHQRERVVAPREFRAPVQEEHHMSSRLLTAIENAISRRSFLRTTMEATTALIGGVLLGPRAYSSGTITFECCTLCRDPATCTFGDCLCTWGWLCCHQPGGENCVLNKHLWRCQECIATLVAPCAIPCSPNGACGTKAQCTGVKCSSYEIKDVNKCPGVPC